MARRIDSRFECSWCGYRAKHELKASDPAIGRDLHECANLGHCVSRLRMKAKIIAVYGKDALSAPAKQVREAVG